MRREMTYASQAPGKTIARRAYNALTFALVTVSFLILWGTYLFTDGGQLQQMLPGAGGIAVLIGSVVLTIVGFILMGIGKSKQSVPLSLTGYTLFSLTFGVTVALALQRYNVGTITYAFGITACVSGIFLIAGVTFPQFFSKLGGALAIALLGTIVVEIVATMFLHVDQTIFDYVVIVIFCGFLGYDSYRMSSDQPTVPNAIFHASNIYLDIVNILLRVLDILDNK